MRAAGAARAATGMAKAAKTAAGGTAGRASTRSVRPPRTRKVSVEARVAQKLRDTCGALSTQEIDINIDPVTKLTLRQRFERDLKAHDAGDKRTWGANYHNDLKAIYGVKSALHTELSPAKPGGKGTGKRAAAAAEETPVNPELMKAGCFILKESYPPPFNPPLTPP